MNYAVLLKESKGSPMAPNIFRKQLLRYGNWVHPNGGKDPLVIDAQLVDGIITNFNNKTLDKVPVPIEHTEDPTKNRGYVIGLEKTVGGLDGLLQIDDAKVAEQMSQGLIPSISAGFDTEYINKETGKSVGPVLRHAALVSHGYLKNLTGFQKVALSDSISAVVLTDIKEEEKTMAMTLEEIKAALKKDHNIDVDALTVSASRGVSLADSIRKALPATVKLADTAGDDLLVAEVKKLTDASKTNESSLVTLGDKVATMEAESAVAVLLSDGKILPTQKDLYVTMHKKDKATYDALAATLVKQVDLSEKGQEGVELTDESKVQSEIDRYNKEAK